MNLSYTTAWETANQFFIQVASVQPRQETTHGPKDLLLKQSESGAEKPVITS